MNFSKHGLFIIRLCCRAFLAIRIVAEHATGTLQLVCRWVYFGLMQQSRKYIQDYLFSKRSPAEALADQPLCAAVNRSIVTPNRTCSNAGWTLARLHLLWDCLLRSRYTRWLKISKDENDLQRTCTLRSAALRPLSLFTTS